MALTLLGPPPTVHSHSFVESMGMLTEIRAPVLWAEQPPPVSSVPAGHCALIVAANAPLSTLKHCSPSSAAIRASLSSTAAATAGRRAITEQETN